MTGEELYGECKIVASRIWNLKSLETMDFGERHSRAMERPCEEQRVSRKATLRSSCHGTF